MTITLPDELRDELEAKATAAGVPSVDAYVRLLIEEALAEDPFPPGYTPPPELVVRDRADLEAKLLEGINSGPPVPVTPEFWERFRSGVEARHAGRAGGP